VELQNKEELRREILQTWLKSAWVYPERGGGDQPFLRVTPGGRLKMRRRIADMEKSLGVSGADLARQEEAGTLPVERERMELAMMVQAYSSERRFIESQGGALGSTEITLDEQPSAAEPENPPSGISET
jgi:hypothetical protein